MVYNVYCGNLSPILLENLELICCTKFPKFMS